MSTMNYQMLNKNKMEPKHDPDNLFLEICNYDDWFTNEESTDKTR